MFCFGIDGVNEITNVPSCKYHKHRGAQVEMDGVLVKEAHPQ
jgi:hypothetical protein